MEISKLFAQLRTRRGVSQAQCAARAGLAASTISRWERGETQPCLTELEKALTALGAAPGEKRDCCASLKAPRGAQWRREDNLTASPPPMGELWRILRLRRGMSATHLAAALGVHASTVSRWEAGEIFPTAAQTALLLTALAALDPERHALTEQRFSLIRPEALSLTREESNREIDTLFLHVYSARPYPTELLLLSRIEELTLRAARDEWAIPQVARLYHAFAVRSHVCGWIKERIPWCDLGLRLLGSHADSGEARNIKIALTITKGYYVTPQRQYRMLENLLLLLPQSEFNTRSQVLREMASAALKIGAARRGTELAMQARETAWRSGRQDYITGSEQIWARAMVCAGRAEEAIAFILPPVSNAQELDDPINAANRRLDLAAMYQACQERNIARYHLDHFYRIIAFYGAAHLKPLGDRLAQKL